MGRVHTCKDREISDREVSKIQQDLNKHARLIMKIFGVGDQHGGRNFERITSAFTTNAEDVPLLSLLVKDHKPVKPGSLPSTRPVIGVAATMIARLSKLMSESVKRLADCVKGSDEMKSREHLQAVVDALNAGLKDEAIIKMMDEHDKEARLAKKEAYRNARSVLDGIMDTVLDTAMDTMQDATGEGSWTSSTDGPGCYIGSGANFPRGPPGPAPTSHNTKVSKPNIETPTNLDPFSMNWNGDIAGAQDHGDERLDIANNLLDWILDKVTSYTEVSSAEQGAPQPWTADKTLCRSDAHVCG